MPVPLPFWGLKKTHELQGTELVGEEKPKNLLEIQSSVGYTVTVSIVEVREKERLTEERLERGRELEGVLEMSFGLDDSDWVDEKRHFILVLLLRNDDHIGFC